MLSDIIRDIHQPESNVGETASDQIFIRDLTLIASIGLYPEEKKKEQPVVISLLLQLKRKDQQTYDLDSYVCYNRIYRAIEEIIAEGHILLVETLAERIADMCLSHTEVCSVRVEVAKPEAITAAQAAGVVICRKK